MEVLKKFDSLMTSLCTCHVIISVCMVSSMHGIFFCLGDKIVCKACKVLSCHAKHQCTKKFCKPMQRALFIEHRHTDSIIIMQFGGKLAMENPPRSPVDETLTGTAREWGGF